MKNTTIYRTRWLAHTRMCTKRGGPIFWIHENLVCPDCTRVRTNTFSWSNAKFNDFLIWRKIFGRMIAAAKTSLKANSAKRTEQVLMIQTQAHGLLTTWAARSSVLSAGLTRSPLMLRWGSTGNEALWPCHLIFVMQGVWSDWWGHPWLPWTRAFRWNEEHLNHKNSNGFSGFLI